MKNNIDYKQNTNWYFLKQKYSYTSKKIRDNIIKYFNHAEMLCVFLSIIFLSILYSNIFGMNTIMFLSTNLSSIGINCSLNNMINAYPVLNQTSYIATVANKSEEKVIEEAKTENVETSQDITKLPFDITGVDAFSKITNDELNFQVYEASSYQKIKMYGMTIANYASNRNIQFEKYMKRDINISKATSNIYIYCTHTSESYIKSEGYQFSYTGTMRTRDAKYNMLSVASVLEQSLRLKGFNVIFDTTPHDYTSYENAYKNSRVTLTNAVEKYGQFGLAIDVHRDAYGDLYSSPTVTINGRKVAQLMIVVGIGTSGYENLYWEENLSIAMKIAKRGEEMYPGLFRPMCIRDSKYNQDINEGSILIETGATGNTHEEVFYAIRCLANILEQISN